MRIAYLSNGATPNGAYRSAGPMLALASRGHEVRAIDHRDQRRWDHVLRWCDLLHIHRFCDDTAIALARHAKTVGTAVVWDDDDDVTRVPRRSGTYHVAGGLRGTRLLVARAKLFELVDLVTTPSPVLAEVFAEAGARQVEVVENYVIDTFELERSPRDGLRVGWVAGIEHRLDLEQVPVRSALQQLIASHPALHVTTIGAELGFEHPHYRRLRPVPLAELGRHVSAFDIGIAPLSPAWAINRARSNIKLKEYAAAGVPWLASPIGPYAGMGEREGGRLVPDDRWHAELEALICSGRLRRRLAKRAARWGREQALSRNVEHWERAFERVLGTARSAA